MESPKILVTKSTVPIGGGDWLGVLVRASLPPERGDMPFAVVSNPEFLRQGSAVDDFLHPARVVLGSDDLEAIEQVVEVYRPILEQSFEGAAPHRPVLARTRLATAETVKFAANAFLALKVSFANEIANICERVGADVAEVVYALGLDERIGPDFLGAGAGWGGSCLGKDLGELIGVAGEHGYDARILRAARDVNRGQRELVVEKLRRGLQGLRDRRVGILGLAFKPGTDDVRDAPALEIARVLLAERAIVAAHDPVVREVGGLADLQIVDDPNDVFEAAEAVVLLTDWPEYADLELTSLCARMRHPRLLVDGRNMLVPARVEAAGLVYDGIGRAMPGER
jgi:nucleotide sugar dehydrogenase